MQTNTLFPMWFTMREMNVSIDPDYAPNIYIMIYHQTSMKYVPIGRSEILAHHIMKFPNKLCRYKIRWDTETMGELPDSMNARLGLSNADINSEMINNIKTKDDEEPYILASFELFPTE